MQKNVSGQRWVVFAFSRTSGNPITGDAANITANLRIDGGAANPVDDTNPQELSNGYYYFDLTDAETNGDLLLIIPVSATPNVIVIGCPGALWTEPAGQKYAASLAAADVSGNLPAAVNEQANIDFGALQKASLNAATPAVIVSDKTGFSLATAPPTKEEISTKVWGETTRALTDKSDFALSTTSISAIWHQLLTAITTTGSVGKLIKDYLDAAISTRTKPSDTQARVTLVDTCSYLGSTGSSEYTDTVLDDSNNPIEGVQIEVYSDSDRTTIVDIKETDINGIFLFNLNPDTYYCRAIKAGYSFDDWSKVVT